MRTSAWSIGCSNRGAMASDKRERQRQNRAVKQAEQTKIARKQRAVALTKRIGVWVVVGVGLLRVARHDAPAHRTIRRADADHPSPLLVGVGHAVAVGVDLTIRARAA